MDRICVIITWPHDEPDDEAISRTYDLSHVDQAQLEALLGEPVAEQIITADEMQAHAAIPGGPHLLRRD